jgi:hypothetical protein
MGFQGDQQVVVLPQINNGSATEPGSPLYVVTVGGGQRIMVSVPNLSEQPVLSAPPAGQAWGLHSIASPDLTGATGPLYLEDGSGNLLGVLVAGTPFALLNGTLVAGIVLAGSEAGVTARLSLCYDLVPNPDIS